MKNNYIEFTFSQEDGFATFGGPTKTWIHRHSQHIEVTQVSSVTVEKHLVIGGRRLGALWPMRRKTRKNAHVAICKRGRSR